MKTFNNQGMITKKVQQTRFPKYIAYIDGKATAEFKIYTKAMTVDTLKDAMATMEKVALNREDEIYLVGIYEKTTEFSSIDEPFYKMVIGARMGEYSLNGWHFWDQEHGETDHGLNKWYSNDFARDDYEEWSREGHFEKA